MVKEVRWTPESIAAFNTAIEYLEKDWSERDVAGFIQSTERVIEFIKDNPKMFRKTSKKNVHEALITPHNLLIYKIEPSHITLITFWDTRQHPRKKKH